VEWSEAKNIRWKVEIPGRGHASPVLWGDRVYVATAVPATSAPVPPTAQPDSEEGRRPRGVAPDQPQRFVLLALDRETGKVVWERVARENKPHEGTHQDGTWASASPVTDGEVVIAHFGSNGLYAYDLDGKLLWSKDLGDMETRNGFGEGSSPALHGEALVVVWDHEGDSFVVALDKRSGQERWRQPRDEVTSWATPLIVERGGKTQVVVSATNRVRSYDLATGKVLWEAAGMTTNTIPSPVEKDGVVYAMSGFRGNNLLAIRLDGAQGDITGTESVLWTYDRDTPYVPSPLLYGDQLYFLKHNRGILSALDAKTGVVRFGPERLEGIEGVYASPVGAGGRIYVVGRNGVSVVLKHGPKLEVLATNTLEDEFDASPAVAGDELFLRGQKYLYRIAQTAVEAAPPTPAEAPGKEGAVKESAAKGEAKQPGS
jgi:outer membrane protein assembly factor BamB